MHKGNHASCGQAVLQIGDTIIVGGGLGRVSISFQEKLFDILKINSEWSWEDAGHPVGV